MQSITINERLWNFTVDAENYSDFSRFDRLLKIQDNIEPAPSSINKSTALSTMGLYIAPEDRFNFEFDETLDMYYVESSGNAYRFRSKKSTIEAAKAKIKLTPYEEMHRNLTEVNQTLTDLVKKHAEINKFALELIKSDK